MSQIPVTCIDKTNSEVEFLNKCGISTVQLNQFASIVKSVFPNSTLSIKEEIEAFDYFKQFQNDFGNILNAYRWTLQLALSEYLHNNSLPSRSEDLKAKPYKFQHLTYDTLRNQDQQFHKYLLSRKITLNERNELTKEWAKCFETMITYVSQHSAFLSPFLTEKQYKILEKLYNDYSKKQLKGLSVVSKTKPLSVQEVIKWFNGKEGHLNFEDAINITTQILRVGFENFKSKPDNWNENVPHTTELLKIVADNNMLFAQYAQPYILNRLGIKLPTFQNTITLVDPSAQEMKYDETDPETERDDSTELDVNEVAMMSREHWTNLVTIDLRQRLNVRLRKAFSEFIVNELPITKYGTANYHDEREVYYAIIDAVFDVHNSNELMRRLQSENFNAPFKSQLITMLINNPSMKTDLFKAMHTCRNKYWAVMKIPNGYRGLQSNAESVYDLTNNIITTLQKRPSNHLVDYTKNSNGTVVPKLKSNTGALYSTYYRTMVNAIYNYMYVEGVDSSDTKLYTKKEKDGYVIYSPKTNRPINPIELYTIEKSLTLQQIVNANPKAFNAFGAILSQQNSQYQKLNSQLTVAEFINTLLYELGGDLISKNPKEMHNRVLHGATYNDGKVVMSLNNFKNFVNLFSGKKNTDLFMTLSEGSTDFKKLLVTKVYKKLENSLETSIMHSHYFDGASYQTHSPINYINDRLQQLHKMTNEDKIDALNRLKEDWYTGYFLKNNCSWFHSWESDYLLGDSGMSTGDMDLYYFLRSGMRDWKKTTNKLYIIAAFRSFIESNGQQRKYLIPTLESKGTAYYMTNVAHNNYAQTDRFGRVHSEASDRIVSVFMTELHRIKMVYEQALSGNPSNLSPKLRTINGNFDQTNVDNDELKNSHTIIDMTGSVKDLKGATFHLINEFRDVWENDFKKNPRQLTDLEKQIVNWCNRYIYTSQQFSDLADFDLVSDEFAEEFEDFYSAVSSWIYDTIMKNAEQNASVLGTSEIVELALDEREYQQYNTLKEKASKTDDDKKLLQQTEQKAIDNFYFWYINHYYANSQVLTMLAGDTAIYKDVDNLTKRLPQLSTGGTMFDTTAQSDLLANTVLLQNKKIMIFDDIKGMLTHPKLPQFLTNISYEHYKQHIDKLNISSEEKQRLLQIAKDRANKLGDAYTKTTGTDGQTLMSIEYLRQYLIGRNELTDVENQILLNLQEIYMVDDESLPARLEQHAELLKSLDKPLDINTKKSFSYDLILTSSSDGNGNQIASKMPVQIKTADKFELDPYAFIYFDENGRPHKDENNLEYRLQKFMLMNDIHGLAAASAMKVFCPKVTNINTNKQNKTDSGLTYYDSVDQIINNLSARKNNPDYVIQFPVIYNFDTMATASDFDTKSRALGIQLQKLIVESLSEDQTFTLDLGSHTETLNGLELFNLIDKLYGQLSEKAYEKVSKSLTDIDERDISDEEKNRLKKEFISKELLRQLETSDLFSANTFSALLINENGNFNLPLDTPSLFTQLQKLIISIVKNQIIGVEMPGGDFIQVANIVDIRNTIKAIQNNELTKEQLAAVTSSDLDMEYEYDSEGNIVGIKWMEIECPFYLKNQVEQYLDENGVIDMSKVPEQLKEIIGYRIPTEGLCSIFPMRIKRFSDPNSGGNIKVPFLMVTISGADFDIDKVYFFRNAFDKNGNYIQPSTDSMEGIFNYLFACYKAILLNPSMTIERMTPQGFDNIEKMSKFVEYLDQLKNEPMSDSDKQKLVSTSVESNYESELEDLVDLRSPCDPFVQSDLHTRNQIASQAIGIAAVHRQVHAFLRHYSVPVRCPISIQIENKFITKNGPNGLFIDFDEEYTRDNITKISDCLRELLGASVDAAKKPIFGQLNFNLYTFDLVCTMFRMGFTVEDVALIMKQPIVNRIIANCDDVAAKSATGYVNILEVITNMIPPKVSTPTSFEFTHKELIDGILTQNATSPKQIELLGFFKYIADVAQDCFDLNSMCRRDSLSGNTWQSMYEYIVVALNTANFEQKILSNRSYFASNVLNIFHDELSTNPDALATVENTNVSNKILSSVGYAHTFMNKFMNIAGIQMNIDSWLTNLFNLCSVVGAPRKFDAKLIRDYISNYHAYLYLRNRTKDGIDDQLQHYYLGDRQGNIQGTFIERFQQAAATINTKYPTIFNANDGLVVSTPTKLREKSSVSQFRIINLYYRQRTPEFNNDFMTEWEMMFYDDSIIEGDYTVRQFAQELLDYVIIKNGFNINNNSFAKYIPYMLTAYNTEESIRNESLLAVSKSILKPYELAEFNELFIRHNRSLIPRLQHSRVENSPDHAFIPVNESPGVSMWFRSQKGVLYHKTSPMPVKDENSNTICYKWETVCYLGAAEIGNEYFRKKCSQYSSKDDSTYFKGLNNWWIGKSGNNRSEYSEEEKQTFSQRETDEILRQINLYLATSTNTKATEKVNEMLNELGINPSFAVDISNLTPEEQRELTKQMKEINKFCKNN